MRRGIVALLFLLTGCAVDTGSSSPYLLEALQTQVADAQKAQHSAETEIEILESRLDRQDSAIEKTASLNQQIASLEARLATLEKRQQQAQTDLRTLSTKAAAAQSSVADLEKEVSGQISNMKQALESVVVLAQAAGEKTYTVKSGDTLEKIAGRQKSTVTAIQKANNLRNDRIYPGQKLTIPHS